jgi:hypothetical protein
MNNNHIKRFALAALLAVVIGLGFASTRTLAVSPERPMAASGTATFRSYSKNDGHVLEYMDDYWFGNVVNSGSSTIFVGDDAAKRLSIGILDFDTSSLPDSATITYAVLQLRVANLNLRYGNPYYILGDVYADIVTPYFGSYPTLESWDFEWPGDGWIGAFSQAVKANEWVYLEVDSFFYTSINVADRTQFKIYFLDDNDDNLPQGIAFYSGNYSRAAFRPTLIVYYDVP